MFSETDTGLTVMCVNVTVSNDLVCVMFTSNVVYDVVTARLPCSALLNDAVGATRNTSHGCSRRTVLPYSCWMTFRSTKKTYSTLSSAIPLSYRYADDSV